MVEIAVMAEDTIELNINGQYIGGSPPPDVGGIGNDTSSNEWKKRGIVCIGQFLYFNFSSVGWKPNNSAIHDIRLKFTVRSGWDNPA